MKKLLLLLPLLLCGAAHSQQIFVNCAPATPCSLSGPSNTETGDPAWLVFGKVNANFSTLFANHGISSIGLLVPPVFTTSGSPLTSSGNITLSFAGAQPANQFLATPDAITGAVSLRSIVADDLPVIDLGGSSFTGNLPVSRLNGGTNASASTFWAGDGTWKSGSGGGAVGANPTGTVGLTPVNGSAATFMRSDAALALNTAINPTMTGNWVFNPTIGTNAFVGSPGNFGAIINSAASGFQGGLAIFAGTIATDQPLAVLNHANTSALFTVFGDGGVDVGSPTGGDQGPGALNAISIFKNGSTVPAVNGSPTWTGNHTIAPASGIALNVQGTASNVAVLAQAGGGTNPAALFAAGQPATKTEFLVMNESGQGQWTWYAPASSNDLHLFNSTQGADTFAISGAGNWNINAPTSGATAVISGAPGNTALTLVESAGSALSIAGATGSNYGASWSMSNTSVGATHGTKSFRLNPTGGFELINNAFSAVIFSVDDAGGGFFTGNTVVTAASDLGGLQVQGAQNNVSLTLNNAQSGATGNWHISSSATGSGFGAGELVIGSGSNKFLGITGTGATTVSPNPSGGVALAVISDGTNVPLESFGQAISFAAQFDSANAGGPFVSFSRSGTSLGLIGDGLVLGLGAEYLTLRGNAGLGFLTNNGTQIAADVSSAGNWTFHAPTSGVTVTINGSLNAGDLLVNGNPVNGYQIVSSLPSSGPAVFEGDVVFLLTDGKLYRFHAGAWTPAVAATDMTGQLTAAQIASIAAAQVTGQLTAAQIASIASTQITGQLTAAQVASLATSQLTGSIQTTQIAAGAITTPLLAAGSVNTAALAANSVTAGTIAAGAVTAAAIQAGSITSSQIAAGTIVAGNIAASTITGAQIAASTITSGNIVAGSIVAGDIAANSLTAAQIQAGSITANEIAANTLTANNIQAGTITAAQMGVTSLSSMTANMGAITAGTISALSGQALIDMNRGFIEWSNGAFMKVSGVGFGAGGNYIEWFGPTQSSASNFAACTDSLGVYWIKTDGSYKFGNSTQASSTTAYQGPSTTTVTIPAGRTQMILELFPDSGLGGHGDGSLKGGGGGTGGYAKSVYNVSAAAGQTIVVTVQAGNSTPTASSISSGTFSMTTMSGVGGNPGNVGGNALPGTGAAATSGGNQINVGGNDGGSAVGNSRAGQSIRGIYGNGFPGGAGSISPSVNNPGLPAIAYVTFL